MAKAADLPMYKAWAVAMGDTLTAITEGDGEHPSRVGTREYGAINSKAAATIHVRYHYKNVGEYFWPVIVRVRCPGGGLHEITVRREMVPEFLVSVVEELEPNR